MEYLSGFERHFEFMVGAREAVYYSARNSSHRKNLNKCEKYDSAWQLIGGASLLHAISAIEYQFFN